MTLRILAPVDSLPNTRRHPSCLPSLLNFWSHGKRDCVLVCCGIPPFIPSPPSAWPSLFLPFLFCSFCLAVSIPLSLSFSFLVFSFSQRKLVIISTFLAGHITTNIPSAYSHESIFTAQRIPRCLLTLGVSTTNSLLKLDVYFQFLPNCIFFTDFLAAFYVKRFSRFSLLSAHLCSFLSWPPPPSLSSLFLFISLFLSTSHLLSLFRNRNIFLSILHAFYVFPLGLSLYVCSRLFSSLPLSTFLSFSLSVCLFLCIYSIQYSFSFIHSDLKSLSLSLSLSYPRSLFILIPLSYSITHSLTHARTYSLSHSLSHSILFSAKPFQLCRKFSRIFILLYFRLCGWLAAQKGTWSHY